MTSPFFIDEQARHALLKLFRESGYSDPVALIYETADVTNTFHNVRADLLAGTNPAEQLASVVRSRLAEVEGSLDFWMEVEVRDRESVASEEIQDVSGTPFVMPPRLLAMLTGYHLTHDRQRFSLRDANNVARSLRSIVDKVSGPQSALE